jgi:hypothetical protein
MRDEQHTADRQAEVIDVQLLDVLAQIQALLRHGRELQREALRVRGIPVPLNHVLRHEAGAAICRRVEQMKNECQLLRDVLDDLQVSADVLDRKLAKEATEYGGSSITS